MGFLLLAFSQISNNAGMLHYTSGGNFKVPMVVRGPGGAAARCGGCAWSGANCTSAPRLATLLYRAHCAALAPGRRGPPAGRGALAAPGVLLPGHPWCAGMRTTYCLRHIVSYSFSLACVHTLTLNTRYRGHARPTGVQLVACSTPANAKALLKSAIRSDNPIVFFEVRRTASACPCMLVSSRAPCARRAEPHPCHAHPRSTCCCTT